MNFIKILGASGSKTKDYGTTSFQVYKSILIDAGNVIDVLGEHSVEINHIFLTHSHSDHIVDLPFIIESYYEKRKESLIIYASKETIQSLKDHTFNDEVWPDFSKINLLKSKKKSIIYKVIKENETISIDEYSIKAIKANHIEGSYGYVVIKNNNLGYAISGDTYSCDSLFQEINANNKIKSLLIECSFPSNMDKLARNSKHLTPKLLKEELKKLKRKDVNIFLYHIKPLYFDIIEKEIKNLDIFKTGGKILQDGDVIHVNKGLLEHNIISDNKFEDIMNINFALSSETNKDKLFELILSLIRKTTKCEAGSLYIRSKDEKSLQFKVVQNDPLDIFMGGTKSIITWNALPFYLEDGSLNQGMVAVVCAKEKRIINIEDVYETNDYQLIGTRKFDKSTGFRSKSMLVIPLINHEGEVIGVLQLINKLNSNNEVIAFNDFDEKITKALASQAAMALTNTFLVDSLEEFLNAFIITIGKAIDTKSPYTMNHIGKVSKISNLIAKAINDDDTIYKDIKYDKHDYKEIELAAWVHDIGKISTPEHIMDKATKLETIIDRIELIELRFELLKKDYEYSYLKNNLSKDEYEKNLKSLEENISFLKQVNIGSEYMCENKVKKVHEISKYTYLKNSKACPILTKDEIYNLTIQKGTLTKEEKDIMNNHANLSYSMLSSLPFPKKYSEVINIAGNHHEKLNGKGHPRGLSEKDLSLKDRIMILSDIFEALTASDRPYKDSKKLTEVFHILSMMAKFNEIDKELLDFFIKSKALEEYSKTQLNKDQCDL